MTFEDDTLENFIHQIRDTDDSLEDIPLMPRPDRSRERPHKQFTRVSSLTFREFSCNESPAVYISGPSQLPVGERPPVPLQASDWNHLRVFYYIAQCQSFTKAARLLKVSQSSLSRTLQHLEIRLQKKVFHRNRYVRKLILTPTGTRILEIVTPSIEQLESLILGLQERKNS